MTRIGLIRHGITDWNMEKRVQGQTDIPLNDTGRLQARALADRLKIEEWDVIFSSNLIRAKETADIIAKSIGLSVQTDDRLREMHCGEIEGTTIEERITKWGEDWHGLPLGIEDDSSIMERGTTSITEIAESFKGKRILIVSYGALLGLTLKSIIPHTNTEEHLHNTSITILRQNHAGWDCELYNCVKHI